MKHVDVVRTAKIAVGCTLSFLMAEGLGLRYTNSVITITLLSILGTRLDTLRTAGKRFAAFGAALLVAALAFGVWPRGPFPAVAVNLFLYLGSFLVLCQRFRLMEGFSMSTVLMLHLWREPEITAAMVLNEAALMAIGVFMGIAANLYMPDRIQDIRRAQEQVESRLRGIFTALAVEMEAEPGPARESLNDRVQGTLGELGKILRQGILYAEYTEKNRIFRGKAGDYYSKYMEMREEQRQLLKRISLQVYFLKKPYAQGKMVADFLRETAASLSEHNNAGELLASLEAVREICRRQALPESRPEFEDRARLYGIVGLLRELLELKQDFAERLTVEEIRRFWKFFLP